MVSISVQEARGWVVLQCRKFECKTMSDHIPWADRTKAFYCDTHRHVVVASKGKATHAKRLNAKGEEMTRTLKVLSVDKEAKTITLQTGKTEEKCITVPLDKVVPVWK